jgi:predicted ArsR family transcriptional regulator
MEKERGVNPTFSIARAKLLTLIKKHQPISIMALARKSEIGRASVYYHLDILKKRDLVLEKQSLKTQGKPVYLTLNKANPMSLKIIKVLEMMLAIEKSQKI